MAHFTQQIIGLCNHPLFVIFGAVATIILICGCIYRLSCWAFCITPIIFRLGIGLLKRKVAIFGDDAAYRDLADCLIDSKIFKSKTIVHIRSNNLDKAKDKTIFLVDWSSFGSEITKVFSARKNDQIAVVIYAKPGSIPQNEMNDIANRANTVVVNFRGRLLNDILTSLITTSYDRN